MKMRTLKPLVISAVLVAVLAVVGFASGQTIASLSSSAGQPGGTPCPSPIASPATGPASSPVASPVVGAAGCPDDAAGGSAATAITIAMTEFAFDPAQFAIPANTDVTATLTNSGALPHDFTIDRAGVSSEEVQAGGSTTVTLNLPPGTYEFHCSVPGHASLGMTGTLTVE
jgi:uncharacterized cupredoxin-like copper-binding protein